MTVFLDTSVLLAWMHEPDVHFDRAQELLRDILAGKWGVPILVDHVLAETFTVAMARTKRPEAARRLHDELFDAKGRHFQLRMTSLEDLRDAAALHLKHFDRRLSFTDCALVVHASQDRGVVASFDHGFDGIVPVVR